MRPPQSTLKPSAVHAYARQLLVAELELEDYKQSVPAGVLASVLLLAACWPCSLSAACPLLRDAPCAESVRKAVQAALPARPNDLLARLLAALRRTLPEHLGRRPLPFAVDLHQRPFSGRFTKGCTRRQKKQGTCQSFTYATLAVLAPEGRFTVGLVPTRPFMRHVTILERLLAQAADAGLQVSYLMLDKEFCSAEVIDCLQRQGVPFLMPMPKRGRKPGEGNRHLFDGSTPVGWCRSTWTTRLRRHDFKTGKSHRRQQMTVTVNACVTRNPKKKEGEEEVLVYAAGGLGSWPPALVMQTYRRRFGIEVAYRQLGQCLAVTSSRDERLRLLLVGVALILCNLWAYLHAEVFASGPLGERCRHLFLLRLFHLRLGLALAIATTLGGLVLEWTPQRSLPKELAQFIDET